VSSALEASGLAVDGIDLVADGDDMLIGGAGDDVLIGGLGLDILNGGAGSNVLIQ
jgi:Ca2+-binding RTX toxin-like protein